MTGNQGWNQGWCYRDQVDAKSAGQTVLDFYTQHYRHSNALVWQSRILAGQILLDQQPTQPDIRLQQGQRLSYQRPPWQEPEVPLAFEIVYADADLWVINKPAGLPVLPGGGFLMHTLLGQLQQQFPTDTPYPIHRLGRGTSGLMVLGRSVWARQQLSRQLREQSLGVTGVTPVDSLVAPEFRPTDLRKTYLALIPAGDYPEQFCCSQPIGKLNDATFADMTGITGGYLYGVSTTGKPAHSRCRVRQRYPQGSLVAVTILTGRPHQIRIHLAAAGYPLIGDPLYVAGGVPHGWRADLGGVVTVPGDCGYYLHAAELTFSHPRHGYGMQFQVPLPQGWPIVN